MKILSVVPLPLTILLCGLFTLSYANSPPSISSLTAGSSEVLLGQNTPLNAQVSDPDGDVILYVWSVSGGTITGTAASALWTAPLQGGFFGVTLTVTDAFGGSDSRSITLQAVPARHLFAIPVPGRPARVAVDGGGTIYVTLPARGEVRLYDPSGNFQGAIEDILRPVGIAASSNRIYIGSEGFHEVVAYDSTGAFILSLGEGRGQVAKPSDIVLDSIAGLIYVSDAGDRLIKIFSVYSGQYLFSFGQASEENAMLTYPAGIVVDKNRGKLLVSDFDDSSIKAFDLVDGSFRWYLGPYTAPVALGQSCFPPPCAPQPSLSDSVPARFEGLDMSRGGWIFAAETTLSVVEVLDADGHFVGIFGGEGSGPGQLKTPTDVAIDTGNRAIVADAGNNRIQVYQLAEYFSGNQVVVVPPPTVPPPSGTGGPTGSGFTGRAFGCSCTLGPADAGDLPVNALPWIVLLIVLRVSGKKTWSPG